ncbi:hypothetical protein E2C01_005221 [Portunus trituberculatus]|uniref:Secreted protein n=1 Tax=Portunus trituberculatus TaxID=210409 RepID=A0A5B7CS19_PORTR|nr:hypothetical protein [Portunus trituberculatus]
MYMGGPRGSPHPHLLLMFHCLISKVHLTIPSLAVCGVSSAGPAVSHLGWEWHHAGPAASRHGWVGTLVLPNEFAAAGGSTSVKYNGTALTIMITS